MKTLQEYLVESCLMLSEASLGRLVQHFENGDIIAILSACRNDWNEDDEKDNARQNKKKTNELRTFVLGMKFGYNKAIGGYIEKNNDGKMVEVADEMSTIVYADPSREKDLRKFATEMGIRFNQDSVLFVGSDRVAEWIATRLPNSLDLPIGGSKKLGKFHPKRLGEYFTKIGKKNFSFAVESEDYFRYSQVKGEMSIPTTVQMRGYDALRKSLAEAAANETNWEVWRP